jgi:hypothetical protein
LSATDVFWVIQIPDGSFHANLNSGIASLHLQNACVYDAFTVLNSIKGVNREVNQVKGIINSMEIKWSGILGTETANEPVNRMRGTFVQNTATVEVTATTPRTEVTALSNGHGFRFVSDPAATSVSHFAQIGFEQNGVFF